MPATSPQVAVVTLPLGGSQQRVANAQWREREGGHGGAQLAGDLDVTVELPDGRRLGVAASNVFLQASAGTVWYASVRPELELKTQRALAALLRAQLATWGIQVGESQNAFFDAMDRVNDELPSGYHTILGCILHETPEISLRVRLDGVKRRGSVGGGWFIVYEFALRHRPEAASNDE
jgi:hypothetical protein